MFPPLDSRGRRPGRLDLDRALAPRAAPRHPRRRCSPPNGKAPVAAAAARPGPPSPAAASRSRSAGATSRAPASWPGCRWPWALPSSRRSRPRACAGVELKWPNDLVHKPPQGRRHPGRAQRRRARSVDRRRRRRAQRAPARRDPPQHRAAGERPHDGRRPRRARDRPQSPARAALPPSLRRRSTRTRARDSRRSPPNGSIATRITASR